MNSRCRGRLVEELATPGKVGPSYSEAFGTSLFRAHFTSVYFNFFCLLLFCFFVHEPHIFYSHTEWNLLSSLCGNS